MSRIHVLNGDAMRDIFPFPEEPFIVCFEAFIDGPLSVDGDSDYWEKRAAYIEEKYQEPKATYLNRVKQDLLNPLDHITSQDEVVLWFEDDLFCQMNMWFVVNRIHTYSKPVFTRVFPEPGNIPFEGFSHMSREDMERLYEKRQTVSEEDVTLIYQLWNAVVLDNQSVLKSVMVRKPEAILHLSEIIQAFIDRSPEGFSEGRPKEKLKQLLAEGYKNFYDLFAAFQLTESVYGFGDTQVKQMLNEINGHS